MKNILSEQTDPAPLDQAQTRVGIIALRFIVLLGIAVTLLAFAWSR